MWILYGQEWTCYTSRHTYSPKFVAPFKKGHWHAFAMSTMYASAGGHRGPRSRQLLRSQSDPGHPHVTPPYTIQPPVPARRTTEPTGIKPGAQYPRSPSRSSSVEHNRDPYVPHSDSLLAQHQTANSPDGTRTSPSTPLSPRSPSPQQLGHQRSSSRQGSIRAPQALNEPLIRDVPPPRTALNASSAVTAPPQTHLASSGQGQGQASSFPVPSQNTPPTTPLQSVDMQRQGSHHSVYQLPPASLYEIPTGTNISHHHSVRHQSNVPHHHTRHRSRSRPPSAASHRYASSITQPMYGHGNPVSLDASRASLNGGVPLRNHHATSLPPGTSIAHHPGTGPSHMPSESPQRSRLHPRVHSSSVSETSATTHLAHTLHGTPPDPPSPPLAANELHRSTQRPPLPENYDGQTRTRYVNMLLALDDISPIFNILASFFTWILLAGFLLFPGTFASWQDLPAGSPQSDILSVVNHVSL